MRHPLVAFAIVLVGYSFVHQHSPDVWFYRVLADHMWSSGDWLGLHFTDTLLTDFHDHLPWSFWPLAMARGLGGEVAEHVLYGGMSLLTFAIALDLARRVGEREAMWHGLWLLPFSENFIRLQPQGRVDQPFVLASVLALSIVGRGERVWRIAMAALCVGVALCVRPPFALALLVLVPVSAWAQRDGAISKWDVPRAVAFVAACFVLPVASHLATGELWPAFLREQVLASLAGQRSDGATSHFGTLLGLSRTFWPGLPFLLLGTVAVIQGRRRGQWFFLAWAVCVVGGLSLGGRSFPHYAWMAYPAFFAIAGIAVQPFFGRRLAGLATLGAAVFALVVAIAQRPSTCELVRAQARLEGVAICPAIATPMPYEFTDAALLVGHFRRDVRFSATPLADPCNEVIVLPADKAPAFEPLDAGRRYRIALDRKAPSLP